MEENTLYPFFSFSSFRVFMLCVLLAISGSVNVIPVIFSHYPILI